MNNILVRSLSGAVYISLILLPLFFSPIVTVAVFGFFLTLTLIEYYKLFNSDNTTSVQWKVGTGIGVFLFGIYAFTLLKYFPKEVLNIIPIFIFIPILIELWRKKENPIYNTAILVFGWMYVLLPFCMMNTIHLNDTNRFPLLAGMFLLIWMNDTFAFLSGKFFGKTKLIERISPKKTWEGTIGGIIFTLIAGMIIGYLFDSDRIIFWIISALIIAPSSVVGDLFESMLKRNANVKDSGNIMPGHGGMLDRFDAALFTVPLFLVWTYIYTYFC